MMNKRSISQRNVKSPCPDNLLDSGRLSGRYKTHAKRLLVRRPTRIGSIMLVTAAFLSLGACTHIKQWLGYGQDRVAQIGKDILYEQDVRKIVPNGLSPEDSANMVRHYIDLWAADNLLLRRAEEQLSDQEKDVERELADYRKSLLVYKFQKKYVEDRIDTLVSLQEVTSYYEQNTLQFVLSDPVCKARLIKLPLQSPYLPMIKSIYKSTTMEDLAQLDRLCESAAEVYTDYADRWISAVQLAQDLPMEMTAVRNTLKPGGFIDTKDSLYAYLVHILDAVPVGQPAPLAYKEENIKQIIISKRKQTLLQQLESEVLDEGWNTQLIKVFEKKPTTTKPRNENPRNSTNSNANNQQ